MQGFMCRALREKNRNGHLVASGAEWTELRLWVVMPTSLVSAFAFVAALVCVFNLSNGGGWIVAFAVFSVLLVSSISMCVRFGEGKSAVIFHADGFIEMPYGRPYAWWIRCVEGNHQHIVSIEAARSEPDPDVKPNDPAKYEVRMYAADGDIIYVAVNLPSSHV